MNHMQTSEMFQILESQLAAQPEFRAALSAARDGGDAGRIIGEWLRAGGVQCSDADISHLLAALSARLQKAMTPEEMDSIVGGWGTGMMDPQAAAWMFKAAGVYYNPRNNTPGVHRPDLEGTVPGPNRRVLADGTIENSGGAIRGYKA
jgi:hypothetical protein